MGMAKVEAAPITKTMTVTFPESTTRNRNQTVTIPNLKSVIRVTVNTGNVSHTVNGEKVTVNVSNGVITRKVQTGGSYTPADSKIATDSRQTSAGGNPASLPASLSYNSGGYSGTLNKSGNATVINGSPAGDVIARRKGVSRDGWLTVASSVPMESYWEINTSTESGTLYKDPGSQDWDTKEVDGERLYRAYAYYSGTLTKSDTRVWKQNYSGSVTKPAEDTRTYAYYYAYTATIEYIDNSNPVLTITKPTPNSPLLALNNTVKEVV